MPLTLYDTMAREKRTFVPADPGRVTLYVCGPTVYSYAHIGNGRSAVVFDLLFRLLRHQFGEDAVRYARNITDVDDKIIAASRESGEPIETITERFERIYAEDMVGLGCLPPTLTPHATAHIGEMIGQIERLIDNGRAYAAEGHVLFDVTSDADYGQLSRRSVDDMIVGARVEVAPYKRNPQDFVLWKPAPQADEPGWDSPWGRGRPGWHLECSAMIETQLGLPVDIHGGGQDLIFPHHENEIAQGRGATGGDSYARYWMHNGFLNMGADKMSKSLGNIALVHDLLKTTPGEALRWALLSAHYRGPLEWTPELVEQSRKALDRLYQLIRDVAAGSDGELTEADRAAFYVPHGATDPRELASAFQRDIAADFWRYLNDDLNTPAAFGELFRIADRARSFLGIGQHVQAAGTAATLRDCAKSLGLLQSDPDAWFESGADDDLKSRVEALIAQRVAARAAKDWPAADRIRAELDALGVVVMDNPAGATWRMKEPA